MARYIDLDKCSQYKTNHGGYPDTFAFPPWTEFEDVAPVIHAHCNEFSDYTGTCYAECSRCDLLWWLEEGTAEENEMFYCPKCGAKMDEEVDNA